MSDKLLRPCISKKGPLFYCSSPQAPHPYHFYTGAGSKQLTNAYILVSLPNSLTSLWQPNIGQGGIVQSIEIIKQYKSSWLFSFFLFFLELIVKLLLAYHFTHHWVQNFRFKIIFTMYLEALEVILLLVTYMSSFLPNFLFSLFLFRMPLVLFTYLIRCQLCEVKTISQSFHDKRNEDDMWPMTLNIYLTNECIKSSQKKIEPPTVFPPK